MRAVIKCTFPIIVILYVPPTKPESPAFPSRGACTDPVPPFLTWFLNRQNRVLKVPGTRGEEEVGLLAFSCVYVMPRHPPVVRCYDSPGSHGAWSGSCSLQKSHLRQTPCTGGPCFLGTSLEAFQYAPGYWGLSIFLTLCQWLGARQDHIPVVDPSGPTPNSPLAARPSVLHA